MNKSLIYDINEKPKKWYEWVVYTLQMVLAVFVATVLIANICHTDISACLFGACVGTIIYQVITKFKSPMFISSCGATVSAVLGALTSTGAEFKDGVWIGQPNYSMVLVGGLIILIVYAIFALIVKFKGIKTINKIFPPAIVGAVTIVIGLNLAKFISLSYCSQEANAAGLGTIETIWSVGIAIITMIVTALVSQYGKGFLKNIPFIFGIVAGFIVSLIPYFTKGLILDFSAFKGISLFGLPDFSFKYWNAGWDWSALGQTILLFVPVALCALLEHYSDHKVLSNVIGTDLTEKPGLDKTLLGDGVASAIGTAVCGLPNTSYGESIATIGFSKVASVLITTCAALFVGILAFFPAVAAIVNTIPSCVFGGCAMILYGYIAGSGLKTLINSKVDLENNKNLIIVSVILTVGISEVFFVVTPLSGVSLAMILGVILNLILKDKKQIIKEFNPSIINEYDVKNTANYNSSSLDDYTKNTLYINENLNVSTTLDSYNNKNKKY